MPIYEYLCHSCKKQFEKLQKISDIGPVFCVTCGASSTERLISSPQFRLSGQGWYETDFKKSSQKNLKTDDSSNKKSAPESKSPSDE